jgi:hypothetical protein
LWLVVYRKDARPIRGEAIDLGEKVVTRAKRAHKTGRMRIEGVLEGIGGGVEKGESDCLQRSGPYQRMKGVLITKQAC